ncbi:19 kDa globulin-like [Hordeum vulgare subsp. vulgare]|uniref:Globulin n=1 Tax=Hordeum vulgare TaxID=4513 RepID=Q84NG7_HORVU|nr:19 kDa globulin-like [Hordeum vulgare subsp. vulgare]AAP31050.1 globulin [Hordeum vulgare]
MGKFIFFAVFLTTLVTISAAQGVLEQSLADAQCRGEVQAKPLLACRQILEHQLTGRAVGVRPFQAQWGARDRCCQQLESVSRGCRCSALRGMVRDYEQSMPPLREGRRRSSGERQQEQGCSGESTAEQQQEVQGGQYGSETGESQQQQGGGYHGVTVGRGGQQQGQMLCRERPQRQQQGEGFSGEGAQQKPKVGRVRLTKVRLPTACRIEPQECSVFSTLPVLG